MVIRGSEQASGPEQPPPPNRPPVNKGAHDKNVPSWILLFCISASNWWLRASISRGESWERSFRGSGSGSMIFSSFFSSSLVFPFSLSLFFF